MVLLTEIDYSIPISSCENSPYLGRRPSAPNTQLPPPRLDAAAPSAPKNGPE